MSNIKQTNEKIAEKVTEGYKKIEESVVEGYKKLEDGVVEGYKKIEAGVTEGFEKITDKCIDALFTKEGETVADAKARLSGEDGSDRK